MAMRLPLPISLLLLMTASIHTVAAVPAASIFSRQDVCAASGLLSCSQGLPDNFCCPQGSRCLSLAGATSALCCPEGKDCKKIKPIICDASAQDVTKSLGAPIKTTVFDVELRRCGSGDSCCPFGYSCAGEECVRDEDQSKSPRDEEKPSATSSIAPSATKTDAPTSTSAQPADVTSAPADAAVPSNGSGPTEATTAAIIGGVVGGCVFLLIVAAIIFIRVRRSNKQHADMSEKSMQAHANARARNSVPFASIISDPILQPNCVRTDFIRKESISRSSGESGSTAGQSRPSGGATARVPPPAFRYNNIPRISIPNPFDSPNPSEHSPVGSRASVTSSPGEDDRPPRTGHVGAARLAPIRAMKSSDRRSRCLTPPTNVQRDPSSESINIFADPGTVGKNRGDRDRRLTHATTFTDLMDQAELGDVHRGKPFVPGSTPRI
ncbi:hypothetical protein HJFPF1_00723 [Paramyrothecium foliicola]|nr:hypothetical protein HJFPF1_00723 [Paramyrothecium foliicola]